jgi:hypothetical protein
MRLVEPDAYRFTALHRPVIRLPRILAEVQTSTHSRFIGVARLLAKASELDVERWVFSALVTSPLIDAASRGLLQRLGVFAGFVSPTVTLSAVIGG